MCGIFGFVAAKKRQASSVLQGLRYLEYRGYDSWGIAVTHDGKVDTQKAVGHMAGAETDLPDSAVALGHTRWATHGGVTEANAHPHTDCNQRLALIHNGIVENHEELRLRLTRDHNFRSQTDTEVLVHLLEETLEQETDLVLALTQVFKEVEGLSAVAVLDATTGQVAAAKNGSPLVLGWGDEATYLASDPIALLDHTKRVTFLEDGQAAGLSKDGIVLWDMRSVSPLEPVVREVTWDARRADLDGYAHFMAKEIHEQPRVLHEIADGKQSEAQDLAAMIREARDVYLIGCGTAHHAALSAKYMLSEIAGTSATTAVASEMSLIYPLLRPGCLVIALSQSGETIDVLDAVREARARGAKIAALVNAEGSSLDRFADSTVLLDAGPERCVLSTKSYTAKLAILQMTAFALKGELGLGAEAVREAGYRLEALLDRERISGEIAATAREIGDHEHLFVLGRHRNYPLALEAALKIKEVSYLHAEGFAAGELKHGVIALITAGTPCLILAPDQDFRREALAAAAEVKARGAYTVGLSSIAEAEFDRTLTVQPDGSSAYQVAVTAQLLAYELAVLLGCDPDKPRNLAKSVTVR